MSYEDTPISAFLFRALHTYPTRRMLSLYTPHWQYLRITFKGRWSDPVDMHNILAELEEYISDSRVVDAINKANNKPYGDTITRMWRVINLLDAVYMGWPKKHLNTQAQRDFQDFKSAMANQYHEIYAAALPEMRTNLWEWKTVLDKDDFDHAWRVISGDDQRRIILDLISRFRNALKRVKTEKGVNVDPFIVTFKNRSELFWFLERIAPNRAREIAKASSLSIPV